MKNTLFTIFLILAGHSLNAQLVDSSKVFTLKEHLNWVRSFHPIMQKANLLDDKATANLLQARGLFDPKWFGEYEDKSFDQKNYFRVGEAGLKVPTWWGIDVKLAYLWSNGDFLNAEATLPQNGQAVVGLEVPLLQGLLFDQRRAQINQAKLFVESNKLERNNIINDLLLSAIETYWNWAYQYQLVQIQEESLNLAEDRFQIIKQSFLQGDKPAVDTLESAIQIKNRILQLNLAKVELQNAILNVSNFLWQKNLTPLEISEKLIPEDTSFDLEFQNPMSLGIDSIKTRHPILQSYLVKAQLLENKERLKREQFKPELRFKYNFLGNGLNLSAENPQFSIARNVLLENYKWGVTFNYPLLLRKERAGLQLIQLEQLENTYLFESKALELNNKVNSIVQLLNTIDGQLSTQRSIIEDYESLLVAENEKFRFGESSIFLLNNREQKLIDSRMKLAKLQVEFQKLTWKIEWAKGELNN